MPLGGGAGNGGGGAGGGGNGTGTGQGNGSGPGSGTGTGTGSGNGTGSGRAGGGPSASELGNYHQMIHDRFFSRWEQPTSIVRSNQDFIAILKIRIRKDGTIILREISTSSGNPVMDESVMSAAQKVTQIAPLPNGLPGETYDVKIQFKLDQN
jgi:TonB family protein